MTSEWRMRSTRRWHDAATAFMSFALLCAGASAASAQGSSCQDVSKYLTERKAISDRLASASKGKQIDAKIACSGFGQLVTNGNTLMKWLEANKDWCQIPASFSDGIKADHGRAVQIRAKACSFAAKQVQMEKQARQGGGNTGPLGGAGLGGASKLPQGAL